MFGRGEVGTELLEAETRVLLLTLVAENEVRFIDAERWELPHLLLSLLRLMFHGFQSRSVRSYTQTCLGFHGLGVNLDLTRQQPPSAFLGTEFGGPEENIPQI